MLSDLKWHWIVPITVCAWVLVATIAIVGSKTLGWPAVATLFSVVTLWFGRVLWVEVLS